MAAPVAPQNLRVSFAPLPAKDDASPALARPPRGPARRRQRGADESPAAANVASAKTQRASATVATAPRPRLAAAVPAAPSFHAAARDATDAPPAYVAPPAYASAWAATPPPSYIAARGLDRSSQAMEWAVGRVQVDVERWLAANPARRRMVIASRWIGAGAALGGACAAAFAASAGAVSAITGVGLPAAALAAAIGLGAAAGGLALVAVAAYATQFALQKAMQEDPMLAQKLTVLREMRGALQAKTDRSTNDEALLRKVDAALAYAGGGVRANLRHEANTVGRDLKKTWLTTAGFFGSKTAKLKQAQTKDRHAQQLDLGGAGERWFRALVAL